MLSHGLIVEENRLCSFFESDLEDDREEASLFSAIVRWIYSEKLQDSDFLVLLLSFHLLWLLSKYDFSALKISDLWGFIYTTKQSYNTICHIPQSSKIYLIPKPWTNFSENSSLSASISRLNKWVNIFLSSQRYWRSNIGLVFVGRCQKSSILCAVSGQISSCSKDQKFDFACLEA